MILKGSQRGGDQDLATHLMRIWMRTITFLSMSCGALRLRI